MLGGQKRDCKWMQMLPRDDLYIYIYIYADLINWIFGHV